MKEIKLLKRTFVARIGGCEKGSKTKCDDATAAHLVKSKLAEYSNKKDADAAAKEAAAAAKEAE